MHASYTGLGAYSMNMVDIFSFSANPAVLAKLKEKAVGVYTEQRWLSHYPDGSQGWAEWRRTGFPSLSPAPGQSNPVPRRIPYGPNEPQLNATNYASAAALFNNNSQNARVWWDKP